jgi:hypothetical protein
MIGREQSHRISWSVDFGERVGELRSFGWKTERFVD